MAVSESNVADTLTLLSTLPTLCSTFVAISAIPARRDAWLICRVMSSSSRVRSATRDSSSWLRRVSSASARLRLVMSREKQRVWISRPPSISEFVLTRRSTTVPFFDRKRAS